MSWVIICSPLTLYTDSSVSPLLSRVVTDVLYTLQNPNVVGSGYIQHPPQKPFAAPLQMQPPTVAVRNLEYAAASDDSVLGSLHDRFCSEHLTIIQASRHFIASRKGEVSRILCDLIPLPETFLLRSTLTSQMSTPSTGHRRGKAGGARRQLEADRISDHRYAVQQACAQQPSTAACCSICSHLRLCLCCSPVVNSLCHLRLDWDSSACRRQIVSHACAPLIYSSRLHICAGPCPDQWQAAEWGSAIQSRQ